MSFRWICFCVSVPLCCYVSFYGIIFMGFCPGYRCFPQTFEWILLAPCLLLAIWSLQATAIAMAVLLAIHIVRSVAEEGFSADTLWGADMGIDKAFWFGVILVAVAALVPHHSLDNRLEPPHDNL
jgi:hypothetical protein